MTQRADSDRILYAVDDKPTWGLSLLLGLTHVSLIFDGIIFLPIMIGKATHTPPEQVADEDKACLFDIQRREDGVFVEIICGSQVEDVDQCPPPIHPSCADEGELSRLGLVLLAKTTRDVLHYHLSGNTYISFSIDD